jgi:hypothetical protein
MSYKTLTRNTVLIVAFAICVCCGQIEFSYADTTPSQNDNDSTVSETNPQLALPSDIDPPYSLGQPSRHRLICGMVAGYSWTEEHVTGRLFIADDVTAELPQVGAVGFTLEAGIHNGSDWTGGTLGLAGTIFGVQNALEYDTHRGKLLYRLAMNIVMRRGGLSDLGDRLRLK